MNTRTEATLDSLIPIPSGSSPSVALRSNKALPLREMLPVVLIVAVDFMGLGIVVPLLPFYTERTGASAFTVGTLISVIAFCQFLAGAALGQLSDRLGRKPILLVSQLGSLVGYVVFALSNSLWLIFSRASSMASVRATCRSRKHMFPTTQPWVNEREGSVLSVPRLGSG